MAPSRSRMEQRQVTCANCDVTMSLFAWHVLDVADYPDLKRQVLADAINAVSCPTCGRTCRCDIPVRYEDRTLGFIVQFIPAAHRCDPHFLNLCDDAGVLRTPAARTPATTTMLDAPHVVFAMDELIRYVVFRDRTSALARGRY